MGNTGPIVEGICISPRKYMCVLHIFFTKDSNFSPKQSKWLTVDVTCFIISLFTAQHVSNVSTSIFRSLRIICWVKHCFSLHKDTTPPQPNHTVTPTHIEPEQYNTWNTSTISRKLLNMDVLTFETCSAVNSEIIKQVISVGLSLFNYQDDARSNKLKIHKWLTFWIYYVRQEINLHEIQFR
jgi:hypothetical protein